MKKKVLILSMTGGFGHIRAGQALMDFAKENFSDTEINHVNVVDIDPSLKKYATKFYDLVSKKFPFIWDIAYKHLPMDLPKKMVSFRGVFNKKIENYIKQASPDVVIFTNVVILSLLAPNIRKVFPAVKFAVTVTDYHGHAYYYFPFLDYYFVANNKVKQELETAGVESQKVIVTGIPINPAFYRIQSKESLKLKHGIQNSLPIVLLVASFGASLEELMALVNDLLNLDPRVYLVFLANGNKQIHQFVGEKIQSDRLLSIEWTNNPEEYLQMADVVISKAGGLTVSECLALHKPLVIVNPIPGQEEYNAQFVQESGAGIKVNHISQVATIIPELLVKAKKDQMDLLPVQNACEKIFEIILK